MLGVLQSKGIFQRINDVMVGKLKEKINRKVAGRVSPINANSLPTTSHDCFTIFRFFFEPFSPPLVSVTKTLTL